MAIPTYHQSYNQLGAVYDPQVKQIQTEIGQLDPQLQSTLSSLDQAKVNAFSDITNSANSKGMLFSGFAPDQEAKYIGTTYLPAVANAKAAGLSAKNSLLEKINEINAQRASQAQSNVSASQTAAADAAYKNAQLGLAQQRLNISAARAAQGGGPKAPTTQQTQASFNKDLSSIFQGYDPKNKAMNYYTEKVVIPQLMQKYGYSSDAVAKQVYAYRKAAFGD